MKIWNIYFISLICIILCGCRTRGPLKSHPGGNLIPGKYHRVEKGQTLWRIAKIYNVDLDTLVRINHISDTTNIEIGQSILIPQEVRISDKKAAAPLEEFDWPLKGKIVGCYGKTINNMINKGLNISAYGEQNIRASRSGIVVFYSPDFNGYGKTIIINHGDGFSTLYSRNSEVYIKPGDIIQKGMVIAKIGTAGRDKDKYLHFEIRKGSQAENPNFYLPR